MEDHINQKLTIVAKMEEDYELKRKEIEKKYDRILHRIITLQVISLVISGILLGATVFFILQYKNQMKSLYLILWIFFGSIGILSFILYILLFIKRIKAVGKKEDSLHYLALIHNEEIDKFNKGEDAN